MEVVFHSEEDPISKKPITIHIKQNEFKIMPEGETLF